VLLIQSFVALQDRIGVGFDSTHVVTARLPIPPSRFADPAALNSYFDLIAERVQKVPGVRDVAFAEDVPPRGAPFGRAFQILDRPPLPPAMRPGVPFKTVSASYFRTMRLRMLRGRALGDGDRSGTPLVTVVNETFAKRYFSGVEPVGQRLLMEPYGRDDVWEVVGVVADEGLSWEGEAEEMAYTVREQHPSDYLALVVRGTLDTALLQEPIRRAVSSVDGDQALADVRPLEQLKTEFMASDRLRSILLAAFAAVAVALAALGLYGVLAYVVTQRRREIGIRAALGASVGSLFALVIRQGMVMTGCGLALGVAGAFAASRLLASIMSGIVPSNPSAMLMVTLMAVGLMACYVPARRATKVDPLVALKGE
jgi:putative ABC transport system permease protein